METQDNYYFVKPYNENLPKPPKENFGQILKETYLHPFTWKARTTRNSYWWSVLCNLVLFIIGTCFSYFAFNVNLNLGIRWTDGIVAMVIYIWIFLAGLGQKVRRLHDVGYSGYWYWAGFTGYGSIFNFYLCLQPSAQRKVKWGKYLFSNQEYPEIEETKVPVPSVPQILKEHFFDCFKWNARSTRTSYWVGTAFYQFFYSIAIFVFYIFYFIFALASVTPLVDLTSKMPKALVISLIIFIIIFVLIAIWFIIAQLGHTVRRLHDAGFSGGWWWISLVPYVGDLLLAFLLFHPTTKLDVKWDKYLFEPEDRIR